jgi:tetratricopeptide (TPR) repeat protein
MSRRHLALASLLLAALASGPARAQENADRARTYFDAGAAAYAAGRFAAAVQAFSEAYSLSPRPSVLFSLAQAERRQYTAERDARALRAGIQHFRQYLVDVPQGGRRADAVEALAEMESIDARLAPASAGTPEPAQKAATRIMVSTSIKEASIGLDGAPLAESPLIEEVKPGKHTVRVSAPGYFDDEREVVSVQGSLVAVEVVLRERPALLALSAPRGAEISIDGRPFGVAPLAPIELPAGQHVVTITRTGHRPVLRTVSLQRGATIPLDAEMEKTSQRYLSYGVLALSGATLAAGGVLVGLSLHKQGVATGIRSDSDRQNISLADLSRYNSAIDARNELRTASYVTFGVAAGLAAAGSILYLVDHPVPQREDEGDPPARRDPPPAPRASFAPVWLPGGGFAAALSGRF